MPSVANQKRWTEDITEWTGQRIIRLYKLENWWCNILLTDSQPGGRH